MKEEILRLLKEAKDNITKIEEQINSFAFEKANNQNTEAEVKVVAQAIEKSGLSTNELTVELKKATDEMIVDGLKSTADIKLKGIVPPPANKPKVKPGRVIPGIAERDGVNIRLCPNCGMAIAEGQICICRLQQEGE